MPLGWGPRLSGAGGEGGEGARGPVGRDPKVKVLGGAATSGHLALSRQKGFTIRGPVSALPPAS